MIRELKYTNLNNSKSEEVIDSSITELTSTGTMIYTINDFFDYYNEVKEDIDRLEGATSHQYLTDQAIEITSGEVMVYSPENWKWNDLTRISNNTLQLELENTELKNISSSLSYEISFLNSTIETLNSTIETLSNPELPELPEDLNNIVVPNGGFETWSEGLPSNWSIIGNGSYILQVGGQDSEKAIRLTRTLQQNTTPDRIFSTPIWLNAFENTKISGYARTGANNGFQVWVGDGRGANASNGWLYSWKKQEIFDPTEEWVYWEFNFTPNLNIYGNTGCQGSIGLYAGVWGTSPGGWVEFDNIKLERLPDNNENTNTIVGVIPPPPDEPVLVSPLNNAINVATNTLLGWTSEDVNFDIYLSTDPNFANNLATSLNYFGKQINATGLIGAPLDTNTTYYWKVRANRGNNTYSIWSETFEFETRG